MKEYDYSETHGTLDYDMPAMWGKDNTDRDRRYEAMPGM
jgi:hypothetical protein